MAVESVNKVLEFGPGMRPNTPDIIQIPEIDEWEFLAFLEYCSFSVGHVDVCVGWREPFAHSSTFGLEVICTIKLEIIAGVVDSEEFKDLFIQPTRVRVQSKHFCDGFHAPVHVNVCVQAFHIHGE